MSDHISLLSDHQSPKAEKQLLDSNSSLSQTTLRNFEDNELHLIELSGDKMARPNHPSNQKTSAEMVKDALADSKLIVTLKSPANGLLASPPVPDSVNRFSLPQEPSIGQSGSKKESEMLNMRLLIEEEPGIDQSEFLSQNYANQLHQSFDGSEVHNQSVSFGKQASISSQYLKQCQDGSKEDNTAESGKLCTLDSVGEPTRADLQVQEAYSEPMVPPKLQRHQPSITSS